MIANGQKGVGQGDQKSSSSMPVRKTSPDVTSLHVSVASAHIQNAEAIACGGKRAESQAQGNKGRTARRILLLPAGKALKHCSALRCGELLNAWMLSSRQRGGGHVEGTGFNGCESRWPVSQDLFAIFARSEFGLGLARHG